MTWLVEGLGFGVDRARLVGRVLSVLEGVDGVDELVRQGRDLVRDRRDALRCRAPESWPRYLAAAGRIIVLAMSRVPLASMFWTLT